MSKILKITKDEVVLLLKKEYNLSEVKFMKNNGNEKDGEVIDDFEYIEGELSE